MKKVEVDVRSLAKLSRLSISDEEAEAFEDEIPKILEFVEVVQNADAELIKEAGEHRNILREDKDPIDGSAFTDALLKAAPAQEKGRVKVRQVIKRS